MPIYYNFLIYNIQGSQLKFISSTYKILAFDGLKDHFNIGTMSNCQMIIALRLNQDFCLTSMDYLPQYTEKMQVG